MVLFLWLEARRQGLVLTLHMAGIYLHVPFCKSRCIYCDFYSTVRHDCWQERYVQAVCRELEIRSAHLAQTGDAAFPVHTVYLGGGTPSLLSFAGLSRIFSTIHHDYSVSPDAEVTIEVNPDDVDDDFPSRLRELGINRVSLGVQSLDDAELRFLRRRHDAAEAADAVRRLVRAGVDNVTIDLIYGLPGQSCDRWCATLDRALSLPIRHLSAYQLSYEPGTSLTRLRDAGELPPLPGEEDVRQMYRELVRRAQDAGFSQYEISNFAVPGYHSRHNASYWDTAGHVPYIGVGPGAHSFDGRTVRRANHPDLEGYIAALSRGEDAPHTDEVLTREEQLEELVMLSLRTAGGLALSDLRSFGDAAVQRISKRVAPYLARGEMVSTHRGYALTLAGFQIADYIIADLL